MPRHHVFDISKPAFSIGNLKDTTRIRGMQLTIMPLGDGAKNLVTVDVASCCKFKSERGVSGSIPLPCCCVV